MTATGPSIRAVCRILNRNSCGSGSICGIQPSGHALILTNAHVAGTSIGREVNVDVESTGDRIKARVIAASYSDKTISDWAMLETTEPYTKVEPVWLSKKKPTGSHYTKGFPRCKAHNGTDIETVSFNLNGVWFWEPDAIGGQSGSGVWSDTSGYQNGLLTWQWNGHGAGQRLDVIYDQAKTRTTTGAPRPNGLAELPQDYDLEGLGTEDYDDPVIENGYAEQTNISLLTLPVWAEDQAQPEPPPDDRPYPFTSEDFVEYCRDMERIHELWRNKFENLPAPNSDDDVPSPDDPLFGL